MKQSSDSLARKTSKKRPGPVPPRRTTSVKDQQSDHSELDNELKSRMKLQKAKVENTTVLEEEEHSGSAKLEGSPKVTREDSFSKSAADNLKAAQIDRSKYLISESNARTLDHGDRSVGRKLGAAIGVAKQADGSEGVGSATTGHYPKKALPLPQRPGFPPYKKMSEPSRPAEMQHSLSAEDNSEQVIDM